VYGKWFLHYSEEAKDRWEGNHAQSHLWEAWAAKKPDKTQKAIRENYMTRSRQFNAWAAAARSWAASQGLQDRLRIVFVLVLEDKCPAASSGKAAFANLLTAVARDAADQRLSGFSFRRSCLPNSASEKFEFRVDGVTMELHGSWSDVKKKLRSGDAWSNDGTDYSLTKFKTDQESARSAGVNALYWTGS